MTQTIEDVEIITESDQDPSTTTLADLMTTYNQAKEAGSRDAAEITGGIKIASVDDIKEIAKEYTLKIQDLLDSDVEQTAVGRAVGKGLAVIDTKVSSKPTLRIVHPPVATDQYSVIKIERLASLITLSDGTRIYHPDSGQPFQLTTKETLI